MPNLLDHCLKRELVANHAPVVIGSLLGSVDAKIIDISNCFPMTLKTSESTEGNKKQDKEIEYVFDLEYLKKMVKFHKQLNDQEQVLGVYISSTNLDKLALIVITYFRELFLT